MNCTLPLLARRGVPRARSSLFATCYLSVFPMRPQLSGATLGRQMRNVSTSVVVGREAKIIVTHEPRHVIAPAERTGAILESSQENDVLTTVSVDVVGAAAMTVRVHWNSSASGEFQALFVPETNFLYLGGGQVSGAVNLEQRIIVTQAAPVLFWSFERIDQYVVEFGELECQLYDLKGNVLDRAAVDPPYEVHRLSDAVHFVSIVAGSTWLTFPAPPHADGGRRSPV